MAEAEAEPLGPFEIQPQPMTVQEIAAIGGKEVLERYIRRADDSGGGALDVCFPVLGVPIIDLQLLASSSSTAINHGITGEFLDTEQEVARQFFALRSEEKKKYTREIGSIEGYGNDMILSENQTIDWTPDLVLGVKPHADGSAITMLLQDKEVEGLQVLKDDQWFNVPVVPQALLINVGDQVEIMTNGIFKSPLHRVVTNTERERITLAVICSPHPDQEIQPVEDLINETNPRLYCCDVDAPHGATEIKTRRSHQ
ncbi:2-oxoglutarate and Fe(II)-dependent oxygenase superfamily protein isoform 1 [Hibiscus syriacus]|uniref:2-oxoglutarate and Fe(II)-dependent oxygenase superfamily protein isoform 1 n=1 Tax=Hibiscus syriacus TaxID=106335 RepID=A0A6A2ZHY7_HIBSY|nr:2-oxoglutarate and Fe(II)-dependent oxygenase superfamily protein isoform 1 [Hibiscus syriacus]